MAQISHREFSVSWYISRYWPLVTERSNQCIDSVTLKFVPNPFPIYRNRNYNNMENNNKNYDNNNNNNNNINNNDNHNNNI